MIAYFETEAVFALSNRMWLLEKIYLSLDTRMIDETKNENPA